MVLRVACCLPACRRHPCIAIASAKVEGVRRLVRKRSAGEESVVGWPASANDCVSPPAGGAGYGFVYFYHWSFVFCL